MKHLISQARSIVNATILFSELENTPLAGKTFTGTTNISTEFNKYEYKNLKQ